MRHCGINVDQKSTAYNNIYNKLLSDFIKDSDQACNSLGQQLDYVRFIRDVEATVAPPAIEEQNKASPPSSEPISTDKLIVPGERMGALRLDMNIRDLVKILGPATKEPPGLWRFSKMFEWDKLGVSAQVDSSTGKVLAVGIFVSSSGPWDMTIKGFSSADYTTAKGIRLGARREDAISALGPPERTVSGGGATSLYYGRRGMRVTAVDLGPHAGEISQIRIFWPTPPLGDSMIIPRERISNVGIGMALDRALALLGGGYHHEKEASGGDFYYWPHFGLGFVECNGQISSVRVARPSESDAGTIRYATADELSLDSALDEVEKAFGQSSTKQSSDGSIASLVCDSSGISFTFNSAHKVVAIEVFDPLRVCVSLEKKINNRP